MLALAPLAGGGLFLGPSFFIATPYTSMLTIEDGTIVANADSYVDISDVTTYAGRYGATWNTASSLANEQAILRAMLYIESLEETYKGCRVSETQELSWPRNYVENQLGTGYLSAVAIPRNLKNALCEAAILEMTTSGILLASSMTREASQEISSVSKKVDVIEKSVSYVDGSEKDKDERFEKIHAWLETLVRQPTNRVYRG